MKITNEHWSALRGGMLSRLDVGILLCLRTLKLIIACILIIPYFIASICFVLVAAFINMLLYLSHIQCLDEDDFETMIDFFGGKLPRYFRKWGEK